MPSNDNLKNYNFLLRVISGFGILLSLYAYYVEVKIEEDQNYVAMCDINQHISCTKAFKSEYGRGFGILNKIFGHRSYFDLPNGVYGMMAYITVYLLTLIDGIVWARILLYLSLLSNIMSVYLAFILAFVLHDFCLVCVTTYVVNFLLLIYSYKRYGHLSDSNQNPHRD